ncbi:MAG: hypothetical protein Q7S55_01195 [Nanoarchaeota archaeon]|nr:hypothetical protein [Nanoarchaeota archaeon]
MMRKFLFVIVILSAMLLVSCAPQVSDEELEAGLDTLSDQDLDAVIDESSQAKALSGQATAVERKYLPSLKGTVTRDRLLQTAQAVKIKRLEKKLAITIDNPNIKSIDVEGGYAPGEEQGIIVING